jgi:opacity protein-like surface antigen
MKVRSLFALALAALLAPVAASAAPTSTSRTATTSSSLPALELGGFVGYETDDVSGIALRVDGELPFQALSPQIKLSWVGSIGFSHLTQSEGGFGLSADFTANVLKVIPAARFTLPLNQQFSLFADAGLGFYYASTEIETTLPIIGTTKVDDSELGLMMRVGAGAWFNVNPTTRIGASLEFDPYFGDFDQNTFIVQAGAMFRM